MKNWIGNLKPGDNVVVECRINGFVRATVSHRTPTNQVVVIYKDKFPGVKVRFGSDGMEMAESAYYGKRLHPADKDYLGRVERQSLLASITGVRWGNVSSPTIKTILGILRRT